MISGNNRTQFLGVLRTQFSLLSFNLFAKFLPFSFLLTVPSKPTGPIFSQIGDIFVLGAPKVKEKKHFSSIRKLHCSLHLLMIGTGSQMFLITIGHITEMCLLTKMPGLSILSICPLRFNSSHHPQLERLTLWFSFSQIFPKHKASGRKDTAEATEGSFSLPGQSISIHIVFVIY